MSRSLHVLALAAVLGPPQLARADDDGLAKKIIPFARASLIMGERDVGPVETKREGFGFALGLAHHNFMFYAELQLAWQRADGLEGLGTDFAFHARRFIHYLDFGGAIVGAWADVGAGIQSLVTRDVSLHRPGFSFGLGGGGIFEQHHKLDGLELELRIEASPATSSSTIARCSGTCAPSVGTDFGATVLASYPFSL